ncbi:MAG: nitroreductase family protein [Sphaerochaetaceae bacterium]|jgi:nitroreductase|nr:nitroreductase family protein [Sphaerochaetaceae bacterium]HHU88586.1 nitroreductase [Spirochaetales bacterium]
MDSALQVLMNRRSVRSFESKQISEEELNQIVSAGLQAATALGSQSWYLTVVQDQQFLKEISEATASALYDSEVPSLQERSRQANFSPFHNAPTVIFVSSTDSLYSIADCANACQNMTLAATALNLGSCYIGSFVQGLKHPKGRDLVKKFELPEGYSPLFAVAIGTVKGELPPLKSREWKVNYIR